MFILFHFHPQCFFWALGLFRFRKITTLPHYRHQPPFCSKNKRGFRHPQVCYFPPSLREHPQRASITVCLVSIHLLLLHRELGECFVLTRFTEEVQGGVPPNSITPIPTTTHPHTPPPNRRDAWLYQRAGHQVVISFATSPQYPSPPPSPLS